ncbi:phage tail sheath subtilisin-like domain-containing protein [Pseudoflavonifractor phocaeensis]|uniref:phage tail sheath C-terminal domain-containing protein n=1 Tax=Pseudoflavonifractor phocaeensis TaxID=1870988 RepID=UPI0025A37D21|nr:phage tail sheath C-terminal domain-containing protein [Pseudoflavonifractor phocaeensis]MDM8238473.1 phage tail sheath subtilisin-like domain-containing protein [Pseudoflavonifractor phocaeensis]
MNLTTHERPGVYSSYDASTLVRGSGGHQIVGLAAINSVAAAGVPITVTSYEAAVSTFGSQEGKQDMAELIRVALLNGAAAVVAVPVANEEGYEAAFEALGSVENIRVMLCDSTQLAVQQALRDSVLSASAARRERIAVVGGAAGEEVSALVERAKGLNCERVVLVAPSSVDGEDAAVDGLSTAAAVAGAIASQSDPAIPLGGAELLGLKGLSQQYSDNDIDLLVRGGVTPVESVNGQVSVVRGITTRTSSGEVEDTTWRELSTILIVDDVIPTLRDSLRSKFRRAKNTAQSRGAIRTQVVLELENKMSREIITGYDQVTVSAHSEDPTVCVVEFTFTVAHGLNQIWLTAHIVI